MAECFLTTMLFLFTSVSKYRKQAKCKKVALRIDKEETKILTSYHPHITSSLTGAIVVTGDVLLVSPLISICPADRLLLYTTPSAVLDFISLTCKNFTKKMESVNGAETNSRSETSLGIPNSTCFAILFPPAFQLRLFRYLFNGAATNCRIDSLGISNRNCFALYFQCSVFQLCLLSYLFTLL